MWSAATLVTPPVSPPIELAAVKEFVRIDADTDDFDVQLADFAAIAVEQIESECNIRLAPQTVALLADDWADLQLLPIGPVTSIESIHYLDGTGAEQLLDAGAYEMAGAALEVGIRPSFGAAWPGSLRRVAGAIRVTAIVGYPVLPRPVHAAALYFTADLFAFRETAVVGTVAGKIPMSTTVERFLVNHRIWL
jgi:uncharacterized phiE125 gp8 family phage protein